MTLSGFPLRCARGLLPVCLICGVQILSGCQRRPKDVLSDKEMIDLMADMQLAEAYLRNGNQGHLPDSTLKNLTESVLAKRGMSYASLDSTLAWYGKHLDSYYDLHDKVDKELARRQRKGGAVIDNMDFEGVNLWHLANNTYMPANGLADGMIFSIDQPDLQKKENLLWAMRLNTTTDVKATLGVDYTDGTSTFVTNSNYGSRQVRTELIVDTSKSVSRIYGTLVADNRKLPLWADSIRLIKLPFDSLTYYKLKGERTFTRLQ